MANQDEKIVTILIGGYPRYCEESKVPQVLESIEKLKEYYREKNAPMEMVEKVYKVEILTDGN